MKNFKKYEENVKNLQRKDYSERISIRNLIRMVIRQELTLPDIQREEVWSNELKSNFIGTLFVIPEYIENDIMPRITVMTDGKRSVLVEGLQRMLALISFFGPYKKFQQEIRLYRNKFHDFQLLRLTENIPPLKLAFSKDYNLPGSAIEDFTGCTCHDIPESLIEKILNLETVINKLRVSANRFDREVRQLFILLNTNEKVNKNEINKCLFLGTPCYDELLDITYNHLLPAIEYRDKRYSAINAVIDTYSLYVDEYTGGYSDKRTLFLKKYQNDEITVSIFKKDFLAALDIAKKIFPEGYCFSEYSENGWKRCTMAAMIPWILAIHHLLISDTNPHGRYTEIQFVRNREKILSLWKNVSIPTGRDNSIVRFADELETLNEWVEKVTDHSNNREKVEARIKIVQLLLEHAIR